MSINRGKREALILAYLEKYVSMGSRELAYRVLYSTARCCQILPTLRSLERRGLIEREYAPQIAGDGVDLVWKLKLEGEK